jgi:protein SCO1/2
VKKAAFTPLTWLMLSSAAALLLLGLLAVRMLAPRVNAAPALPATGLSADIVIPPRNTLAADFRLRDQNNQPVSISALRGKVVAITFLDSHCKQACPLEADQLARVQRALGHAAGMSLLVVSVAPATDTPESEKAFASEHGWSGDWHWLVGSPDRLAAVWKAYSIEVQPSRDDILHSSVLYLVDKSGYVRAGFATGLDSDRVTRDVRILLIQSG